MVGVNPLYDGPAEGVRPPPLTAHPEFRSGLLHLRLGCAQVFGCSPVFPEGLEPLGSLPMSTSSLEVRLVGAPMGLLWRWM